MEAIEKGDLEQPSWSHPVTMVKVYIFVTHDHNQLSRLCANSRNSFLPTTSFYLLAEIYLVLGFL